MTDPTTTTPDRGDKPEEQKTSPRAQLYLVLECDRPRAAGARYDVTDIDEVIVSRGSARHARRESQGGVRRLLLHLPGPYLSSLHARFLRLGSDWFIEDAHSTNGTFLNGERVARQNLGSSDIVELGRKLFMLSSSEVTHSGAALDLDGAALDSPRGMRTLIPSLADQFAGLRRIASTPLSVVVLGETGTGKELLSAAVHELSGRGGPLVPVNCGGLMPSLAESQLFGHTRGAFSGAIRDEPGFLRSADGGSLLLDEIGDLPESIQPVMLRVLQDRCVVPVGSSQPRKIDVRFMAATHKDLAGLVAAGKFRRDLWTRLNGFTLHLPPLRDRIPDLGLLIADILSRHSDGETRVIAPDAARALLTYDWPSNVRELEQCVLRSYAVSGESLIRKSDLPPEVGARSAVAGNGQLGATLRSAWSESDLELRAALLESLQAHRGNVSQVAQSFGKARVQIQRWMKRFGFEAERFRK